MYTYPSSRCVFRHPHGKDNTDTSHINLRPEVDHPVRVLLVLLGVEPSVFPLTQDVPIHSGHGVGAQALGRWVHAVQVHGSRVRGRTGSPSPVSGDQG